jgi:hypothetical protein
MAVYSRFFYFPIAQDPKKGKFFMYPWIKFKKHNAKVAVRAAMTLNIYDDSINYDDLVDFCKVSENAVMDDLTPIIKDLQRQYKEEYHKTSIGIESALNAPIDYNTMDAQIKSDSSEDQNKNTPKKKETRGRKNRGLTGKHYNEYKEYKKNIRNIEQPTQFNDSIVERVQAEIINDSEIEQYKELTQLTFDTVLDDFKQNNAELIKKHPYNYYKKILIALKKQLPKITADDIDKCFIVWDCLAELLTSIGLYITWGAFEQLTSIYKYQIEDREKQGLSPKYTDFVKKINKECDTALINELEYNPYNQTNKIFLAKVRGFVEKTEPKQIEVHHDIRNYDSLPMLGDGKKEKF